jgi:hypothetical protein
VRRNKFSVLTALGILVVLLGGIVGTTLGLLRALAAEQRAVGAEANAVQEAAIARAVTSFLQKDLLEMADAEAQLSGGWQPDPDIKLCTLLERAERRVKERFADQPEVEAAVRHTLGMAFEALAEHNRSAEQLTKVLAYREAHLGPDHPDTLECMLDLADALGGTVRRPEALPLCEAVLQRINSKAVDNDLLRMRAMFSLQAAYANVGRGEEAFTLVQEVYGLMKAKLGPDHPRTLHCLSMVAWGYGAHGRYAEAVSTLKEVLRLQIDKLGPNHPDPMGTEWCLAMQLLNLGRVDEALTLSEQNYKRVRNILGAEHGFTLRTMSLFAEALQRSGREKEALPVQEEVLKLIKAKYGADHHDTLDYVGRLAHSYFLAKQPDKAIPLYEEYLRGLDRYQSAWAAKEKAWAAKEKAGAGFAFLTFGTFAKAEKALRESLSLREKTEPDLWSTFQTRSLLGGALLGQRRYAEAEPLLLSGYGGMQQRQVKIPAESRKELVEALDRLVQLYDAWGKKDQAKQWLKQLEQARAAEQPTTKP